MENGFCDVWRVFSRIRHRQFGILVTTSYVSPQAYQEIQDDKHPILIIAGVDIVQILKRRQLDTVEKLDRWLSTMF